MARSLVKRWLADKVQDWLAEPPTTCARCGRKLVGKRSVAAGMGPVCKAKTGQYAELERQGQMRLFEGEGI